MQIALPAVVPRAVLLWALIRLVLAVLPLAGGGEFGAVPTLGEVLELVGDSSSPIAIVVLTGLVGLIDVHVRGERILWANLGVTLEALCAVYAAAGVLAEVLLALVLR